jgi:guanine deaminase
MAMVKYNWMRYQSLSRKRLLRSDMMTEADFMRLAIEKTREGIAAGQSPFGSAIVRGGEVVAVTHNTVWMTTDPTAHAEVNCIRAAAGKLKTIFLTGCTLYSTTEPCPMCLSAIHWAKIDRVVYGATIADAAAAGFAELLVNAKDLATMGRSPLKVESGLLQQECAVLFDEWKKSGKARAY